MIGMNKCYRYETKSGVEHFFCVRGLSSDVIKLTRKHIPKTGRPYVIGITFVKYTTFIGTYGYKIETSTNISEIRKTEFEKVYANLVTKFSRALQ